MRNRHPSTLRDETKFREGVLLRCISMGAVSTHAFFLVLVSPGGLLRCLTQWRSPSSSFPPRLQPRPSTSSPYQSHLLPRLAFSLVSPSAPSACHCRFAWSSHPRLQHIWICNCKRVEQNVSINIANEGGGHCLVDEGGRAFVLTFVSPWAATRLAFGLISPSASSFVLISPSASSHLWRVCPPSACHRRFTWPSHPRLQHTWICDCKRVEQNVSINIANE